MGLGMVKDGVNVAQPAAKAGFGIARQATEWGFWFGRGIGLQAPAAAMEFLLPENPASKLLWGIDKGVGAAEGITHASIGLGETITTKSLQATDAVMTFAGVEDGHLWKVPASMLLGEETATAVYDVSRMVSQFVESSELSLSEVRTSSAALAVLQHEARRHRLESSNRGLQEEGEPITTETAREAQVWMAVAATAYGAAACKFLGLYSFGGALDDHSCILEMTGISREDVLLYKSEGEIYCPGYWIGVHHGERAVVVSFRGTMRAQDVLTDLVCQPTTFWPPTRARGTPTHDPLPGQAHEGFLSASLRLDERLAPVVEAALRDNPAAALGGYRVVLCGHSLGAALAAMLAIRWQGKFGPDVPVHGWSFAPPCTVDADTAKWSQGFITGVVVGDDMVPRFGIGTSNDLRRALGRLNKDRLGIQVLQMGAMGGEAYREDLS